MTLPYLTYDCIYYILQYLQNDYSTLFNCLLVNRFWCKSTIPLLYANPFEEAKRSKKYFLIILTLVFCFNKEAILQFKKQLLGINQFNNINIDEEYKPLFEYPKYLKVYNYSKINCTINGFIRYNIDLSFPCVEVYGDIIQIFHPSLLRQSRNIEQLDIELYLFYKESFNNFNVQNFVSNLTKLNSLSFYLKGNSEIEQEILRSITNNLRQLIIVLPRNLVTFQHIPSNNLINTTCEKLYKIIQRQNKLEIFKIRNCYSLLNNVLLSLEFQKHSLVHIEFNHANFFNVNLKSFNNLYNLEYLNFEYCEGILLNQCEILNFASFKLKELSIMRNKWNVDVTPLMIKYLGASLQRLLIEPPTNHLIKNISMYCPNLNYLKLDIWSHTNLSILTFFNLKVKMLNITIFYDFDEKFYINLANNISINVSKISINSYTFNRYLRFKKFLENCHSRFEMINLNLKIKLKFLKIVLKYIKRSNNSLKILGMKELDKELNDKELKLLNQIKAKGVRIVEFKSIHFYYKGEYDI